MTKKLGRNDPYHCGSGEKYKRCCLPKDKETAPMQQIPFSALPEEVRGTRSEYPERTG